MCYRLWYIAPTMLPAGGRPATSWVNYTTSCNTQSSAPEDGQNYCPKHVELTGIINKPLLLHLVGCVLLISIMHDRPATSLVHYTTSCNTQSSAPEDGQNNCPKHVELTGIINKP